MAKAILKDSELLVGSAQGVTFQREDKTENYVEVPPALLITDADGAVWSLGTDHKIIDGRYHFNVIRNDKNMGVYAEKIVYEKRRVNIYTAEGRFVWTGRYLL